MSVQVSAIVPERLSVTVEPSASNTSDALEPVTVPTATAGIDHMEIQVGGNLATPPSVHQALTHLLNHLPPEEPAVATTWEHPLPAQANQAHETPGGVQAVSYQFRPDPRAQAPDARRGTLLLTITAQ